MSIVERVKRLCLTPAAEWPVIAEEPTEPGTLLTSYILPLASIGAIAGLIGGSVIGYGGIYRVPLTAGIGSALFQLAITVVFTFVVAFIVNALAPHFGAQQNFRQALKIAAYSFTPGWVAGVLNLLPLASVALVLLISLYGLYLMYLGLPRLMHCPEDRSLGYTAVTVACTMALGIVLVIAGGIIGLTTGAARSLVSGGSTSSRESTDVQYDKNSLQGKLQNLGQELEKSGKKMEDAEKRGDQAGQVSAALEGLGTLFGGGARVDPVSIEELKKFVPDTVAGLAKTSSSSEKSGLGIMVSRATATYGQHGGGADKEVRLEIVDTGGVSGLMSVASWAGVQEEKDSDDGYERTRKVGGRLTHERVSKRGGNNEFTIVVGERFTVSAESRDLDIDTLKSVVAGLNLAGLESMKEVGVQSAQK